MPEFGVLKRRGFLRKARWFLILKKKVLVVNVNGLSRLCRGKWGELVFYRILGHFSTKNQLENEGFQIIYSKPL